MSMRLGFWAFGASAEKTGSDSRSTAKPKARTGVDATPKRAAVRGPQFRLRPAFCEYCAPMSVGPLPRIRFTQPVKATGGVTGADAPKLRGTPLDAMTAAVPLTKAVVAAGPVPELDWLIKSKPNARVALVQGSFDWIHNGHLDMIGAVAASKSGTTQEPFDLVVVMPTTSNKQKAFLADGVAQRFDLVKRAVAGREDLRGRVAVSDAAIKNSSPDGLIRQLLETYGTARFTFVQGADAFNQSAKWPTFSVVEDNMDLAVVPRAGVTLEHSERVDQLIDVQPTAISSSEIRKALDAGDLSGIKGRVPASTFAALTRELARRQDPTAANLQWFAA